ncbi:MAG: Hsp20/alpha crystallin family protein [Candidatus Falkowbacteria bacterium]|nr:Hsp20/alpha crystallin family protein [Candidatus Falkowbacteria bacterium]
MFFNKKNHLKPSVVSGADNPIEWLDYEEPETEGQLAIDVYQTDKKIIIKSTIAGVKPENLKISLHHDLLTIKGTRAADAEITEEDYLYRECYWGSFSRSIILPAEVDNKRVEAELENGVLTISLYKTTPNKIEIKVKD